MAIQDSIDAPAESIKPDLDYLAGLPENWDEDGGGPYPRSQLSRVEEWWKGFTREYHGEFSRLPPAPRIGQAEGRSVDMHWRGEFSFLVNIPADENEPCAFYGFSIADPDLEFQGKAPLESLGGTIKTYIKDFFDDDI